MIFTSLSPNTQKRDFELALRVLIERPEYLTGPYTQELKDWFKKFFGTKYVASYESARSALYFVLKELGIKKGDEVLLQAFTCVAAVNPIKWAQATPVFVDINLEDFNLDLADLINKVNEKTKAIIVQHTFGYPACIGEVLEFAGPKKITVIEDCAHTIGTQLDGKKLGTFGDAAIFSLGRDKAVSACFGGVAITNNKEHGKSLSEGEKFLSPPLQKWVARKVLYTIVAYLTRKFYDKFSLGKFIHFIASRFGLIDTATSEGEKKEGKLPIYAKSCMPNAFARIALHQLKKLDKINKQRQRTLSLYMERLAKFNINEVTLPNWKKQKKFYPLRVPLLVKKRDELLKFAENRGVLLGDWYDVPVAPRRVDPVKAGYKQGSCPKAEEVCKEIINLPLHLNLSEEEALKVVTVIRDFYR